MRKLLITLLMASAATTPALAAGPRHDSDRQQTRAERQQAREDARSERAAPARTERAAPAERTQRADRPQIQMRAQSPQNQPRAERPQQTYAAPARVERNLDSARAENARREAATAARDQRVQSRAQTVEQLRDDRTQLRDQRVDAREQRQAARTDRVVNRARPPVISTVPRPGTQPPAPVAQTRTTAPAKWRVTWRDNDRYDWQNHRRHHRSLFHLGFYYDPYGWGYQPFSIGWRLWPSYYSRNYWITDPWMYRLPYAPAGYVWIRYWNDALLVDTWSGQVVDMIPNFFW
jgi:hypothetical protein